jgi:zinc transporter ZupT
VTISKFTVLYISLVAFLLACFAAKIIYPEVFTDFFIATISGLIITPIVKELLGDAKKEREEKKKAIESES